MAEHGVFISRRQFIQQTAFAAAGLYGWQIDSFAEAPWTFEAREQSATQLDAAAIRKLASEVTGHIITRAASDYESSRLVFNRAFDLRPALMCAVPPRPTARALSILP